MKKIIILLLILITPTLVNAETNYLYDVLKNEAENNGLAREYTGEHHDSFTEEPTKKIYHWYAETSEDETAIQNKNNVIFGNYCWRMLRTTDTGGVKLFYSGVPNEGKCGYGANGTSYYNNNYNTGSQVGYMYNKEYETLKKSYIVQERLFNTVNTSTSYYYADSFEYDNNSNIYSLVDPYKIENSNDLRNLAGKYTFKKSGNNYTSTKLYYIVYVNGSSMYYIDLIDGHDFDYYQTSFTYGSSYTDNGDGTYTINNPTTFSIEDWDHNFNNIKNKYICKNTTNNTCSDLMLNTESNREYINNLHINNTFKFANSFSYNNETGLYTLSDDSVTFWKDLDTSNRDSLSNHHYTCFNTTGTCDTISYIFNDDQYGYDYLNMNNGKGIEDVLNEMFYDDDVNTKDSTIKNKLETWYENNLINYSKYIEDTIYCNDRSLKSLAGFNPNGGPVYKNDGSNNGGNIEFKNFIPEENTSLSCTKQTDQFSINNNKAKLKYPIGLLTNPEINIMNFVPGKTGEFYWLMSPRTFSFVNQGNKSISSSLSSVNSTAGTHGIISLKPNITYLSGDGTPENPYITDCSEFYSINVEIVDETEDINIEITDLSTVPEGEEVNFRITPIKGFKVKNMRIIDEENNEVVYNTTDNKNYTFTMPATDVTIIPIYERVKNAVNVEDNVNTKEFVIEVNDSRAVVYEDTVRFRIDPEEGYEVEKIEITDEENNNISYKKTNNKNEYEFTMPDTDVLIKPYYRLINKSNLPNPNTKRQIVLILISILILGIMTTIFVKKKKRLN